MTRAAEPDADCTLESEHVARVAQEAERMAREIELDDEEYAESRR